MTQGLSRTGRLKNEKLDFSEYQNNSFNEPRMNLLENFNLIGHVHKEPRKKAKKAELQVFLLEKNFRSKLVVCCAEFRCGQNVVF